MPYVFDFDHAHRKPPMDMKDLLGGKGANLAEMTSVLELPVPPGFTIGTTACRDYMEGGWPDGLTGEVAKARARLEKKMGKRIGDPSDPLLVSVRSGAKFSMPGMMDTVLNLGLNDQSVEGLAKQTDDERFAYDSYRRFVAMYGRIVLGIPADEFDTLLDAAKELAGTSSDAGVPIELLRYLVDAYQQIVERHTGKPFPQDPDQQLRGAIEAVFASWNGPRAIAYRVRERIAHDLGTAVNVQAMVFGNRDDTSGTGVGFTRDPATGATGEYGDFLVNAQGEDVVAGIRNTEPLSALKDRFPKIHKELLAIFARLESHYRDMCDTEFTIEQGKLWMLQTRVGKRTGRAALKMAVDMVGERAIRLTREEAVQRITGDHLDQVLHPQFAGTGYDGAGQGPRRVPGGGGGPGLPHRRRRPGRRRAGREGGAGPQRDLARRRARDAGRRGDPHRPGRPGQPRRGRGPRAGASRRWSAPRRCGSAASVVLGGRHRGRRGGLDLGRRHQRDGRPGPGAGGRGPDATRVRDHPGLGRRRSAPATSGSGPTPTTGPTPPTPGRHGAEGIGLCRTEHMFLAEDRLPIVRRMILASTPAEEEGALEALRVAQRADFEEILEAMDGLPGDHQAPRPAAPRVPPRHRRAGHQGGHRGPDRGGEPGCSRRPRRGTSTTRCSAPGACGSA